ncbi:MAG: extracellular solute-binding protein [Deltaproteobacteria bacterium]|nr:MAG: extracellular solute-binding protein [Deltaproteobacteria bacterium]
MAKGSWLKRLLAVCLLVVGVFLRVDSARSAEPQDEWKKIIEAAKKEGKIVAGGPPTAILRQKYKETFEKRFAVELELVSAPGPQNAGRATAEFKAGVRYFDVLHGGSGTLEPLVYDNVLAPFSDYMILPEIKDPRQWWGGHMWEDNVKTNRFIYSFSADFSTPPFYNTDLVKPGELSSYDDLLLPKWKGKIGFFEPRMPSAGQGLWGFLMKIKGKDFLQKLAEQNLFISRDGKQIADALAKGTLAVGLGVSQRFVDPYIKTGLPIKPLMSIKEGMGGSNGFGTVAVMKNAPHPNAAKVYINWLLGKEGQDLYGRALTQGTRRLDVETKWLAKFDSAAAKDVMTPEEFEKVRFYGEDIITEWREPGGESSCAGPPSG